MHIYSMQNAIDIKELRRRRNWTQDDMGQFFGVDKSTVWRWENEGIPSRGATRKAIEREWDASSREHAA
jgi:DNA-binding XRE family transcriptional regulator